MFNNSVATLLKKVQLGEQNVTSSFIEAAVRLDIQNHTADWTLLVYNIEQDQKLSQQTLQCWENKIHQLRCSHVHNGGTIPVSRIFQLVFYKKFELQDGKEANFFPIIIQGERKVLRLFSPDQNLRADLYELDDFDIYPGAYIFTP